MMSIGTKDRDASFLVFNTFSVTTKRKQQWRTTTTQASLYVFLALKQKGLAEHDLHKLS